MAAGKHPSDLELLEYVEGELAEAERDAVRTHLERCQECTAAVADASRGREALRSSPPLELPAGLLEQTLASLPRQERERRGPLAFLARPRRAAAVLAPVAAVVIAVVTVTVVTGGDDRDEAFRQAAEPAQAEQDGADAGAEAPAEPAAPEAPAEEAPAIESAAEPVVVARVAGPARAVARLLEAAGLDVAQVEARRVQVVGATAEEVERALAGRESGAVEVVALGG